MNIYQILAICGMLSPIIYTIAWIVGGFILDDYNHIRDDVSSLYAVGAPKQQLFQTIFAISIALLFVFSLGLHSGINNGEGSIVGPIFFMASAFLGLIVAVFFPLDEGGELVTWKGKMHLILIVISGLLVMTSMILLGLRTNSIEGWSAFAWFSFISVPITIILMIVSGIYAGGPYMGLVERFMVEYYQLYYFIIALFVYLRN
jgi:hypothetical protein